MPLTVSALGGLLIGSFHAGCDGIGPSLQGDHLVPFSMFASVVMIL
jgi:hypothetical protein